MGNRIEQGTVRASKRKNAMMKLKRQFRGYKVAVIEFKKVGNNEWEYLLSIKED